MSTVWHVIRQRSRPPTSRRVSLTVYGPGPETIVGAMTPDNGSSIAPTREDRHFTFVVPNDVTGGAWIYLLAAGFEPASVRIVLPLTDTELDAVTLDTAAPLLPLRVVPAGKWFQLENGDRWTQIGCSDFRLFERFLNQGEETVRSILRERRAIGFNQLRVFGTCHGMFRLYPTDHPNYYAQLAAFAELVGREGLRLEFTVFADATQAMPATADQVAHFNLVCNELADWPHTFVELVNENDQTINAIRVEAFSQPVGLISSHGSNGADALPPQPPWTYQVLHPSRPADWPRKGGHNAMEDLADPSGRPAYSNELCRPDQGRGAIVSDWFDAAANGALLAAGAGTFHSQAGKQSLPLEGAERACAEAFVAGARAVSLDFQRGSYTAGHLHDSPIEHRDEWASRTHGRIVGNRACVNVVQRTAQWKLAARNGWRLERQNESVLELVR